MNSTTYNDDYITIHHRKPQYKLTIKCHPQ